MTLFNIGNASEITNKDLENAHKLLEYYVRSLDNINEEHREAIFKMLTDSGFLYGVHNGIRQEFLNILMETKTFIIFDNNLIQFVYISFSA